MNNQQEARHNKQAAVSKKQGTRAGPRKQKKRPLVCILCSFPGLGERAMRAKPNGSRKVDAHINECVGFLRTRHLKL